MPHSISNKLKSLITVIVPAVGVILFYTLIEFLSTNTPITFDNFVDVLDFEFISVPTMFVLVLFTEPVNRILHFIDTRGASKSTRYVATGILWILWLLLFFGIPSVLASLVMRITQTEGSLTRDDFFFYRSASPLRFSIIWNTMVGQFLSMGFTRTLEQIAAILIYIGGIGEGISVTWRLLKRGWKYVSDNEQKQQ